MLNFRVVNRHEYSQTNLFFTIFNATLRHHEVANMHGLKLLRLVVSDIIADPLLQEAIHLKQQLSLVVSRILRCSLSLL